MRSGTFSQGLEKALCVSNRAILELTVPYLSQFNVCSQDRVLINQWKDEMISGFRLSSQIMANMNKKVRSKYGAEMVAASVDGTPPMHRSLEKCSSDES